MAQTLAFDDAEVATVAPLSRSEKDPARGLARRKKLAAVLSCVGKMGIGAAAVIVVKTAAVAATAWTTAPAMIAVFAAAATSAVLAGTWEYRAQKGDNKFSWKDWARTVNNSRSAKMAFGLGIAGGVAFSFLADTIQSFFGGHAAPAVPAQNEVSGVIRPVTVLPVDSAPAVDVAAAAAPVATPAPYIVQPNETLWELASRMSPESATAQQISDRVLEIAALNDISNVHHIEAGQSLTFGNIDPSVAAPHTGAQIPPMPSVTATVPGAPVAVLPAAEAVLPSVSDADGVRTVLHPSGITEIFAAPAAPAPAAAPAILPPVGECMVTETPSALKVDSVMDPKAVDQPGSGIDFRNAAQPEPFRVSLSPTSAPMNAQEFLENHGVPEAQDAFKDGRFVPQP